MKKMLSLLVAAAMLFGAFPAVFVTAEKNTEIPFALDYRDVDFEVPMPKSLSDPGDGEEKLGAETIPTSYSSVPLGKISSAKHQGNYGTCWAFSAISNAETTLRNKTGTMLDLSEMQLAYFFAKPRVDPLGNLNGDSTVKMENYEPCADIIGGGNHAFTMWGLASWVGSTTEDVLPYTTQNCAAACSDAGLDGKYATGYDVAHLQNAYIIPYDSDSDTSMNAIKQSIMDYGSVACSYYHNDDWSNSNYYAYFGPKTSTNHAVTIVGWNDDFPSSYFKSVTSGGTTYSPKGNGAWLIKNSWGSTWGTDGDTNPARDKNAAEKGYLWLSYYDYSLYKNGSGNVFVYDYDPADTYQYNYQYDGSFGKQTKKLYANYKLCATYTVKGLTSDYERIDAVGVGVYDTDMNGTVSIYLNPTDSKPVIGFPVATAPIHTTFSGFYTVKIPNGPVLQKGQKYTVVVSFDKTGYVYVDSTYTNSDWIQFNADVSNDKTYIVSTGGTVTNLGTSSGFTARLKAYTNDVYPVTYDANGGTGAPETQQKFRGQALTLSSTVPTKSGHRFLGWATSPIANNATYQPGDTYQTDAPLALYALWEETVNKSYLEALILQAFEEEDLDCFTTASAAAYWAILQNAEAVLNDPDATQTQVNAAAQALADSYYEMVVVADDRSALQAAVDNALTDLDNYTVASANAYRAVLDRARSVLNAHDSLQSDVDNAVGELAKATADLVSIKELKAAVAGAIDDLSGYTTASAAAYSAALQTARTILEKADATKQEIDAATDSLANAALGLTPKGPDKSALRTALATFAGETKLDTTYTEDTVLAYRNSAAAAQIVFDNADATQTEVDAAASDLNAKYSELYQKLSFATYNLALGSSIALNVKADKTLTDLYEDVHVEYVIPETFYGLAAVEGVAEPTEDGTRLSFQVRGIAAERMSYAIDIYLCGTHDGKEYRTLLQKSVRDYCLSRLNTIAKNANPSAKMIAEREVIANMLAYGVAAQQYSATTYGYDLAEDQLATYGMTDVQKSWISTDMRTLEKNNDSAYATVDNPTIKFTSVALIMSDYVKVRIKLDRALAEGEYVSVTDKDGFERVQITECDASNYILFTGAFANEMSEPFFYTVRDADGNAISNTFKYTIETFAAGRKDTQKDYAMIMAMMRYGLSANKFAPV